VKAERSKLEAPHRRREGGAGDRVAGGLAGLGHALRRRAGRAAGRAVEKVGFVGFVTATWVVARVPALLARWVIGTGSQAGYLFWPTKRRWSNENFGHVLGLPPDDPRVRRLALSAYQRYARYLVEAMRLESQTAEAAGSRVVQSDLDHIEDVWKASPGGLIFALGHVGNNEAVAAAVAGRGWPINVVADDSAFPEVFERFRRIREAWGVRIIPWRNLRDIYAVLRRREMLALLIDWGYRSDGIPVRLFGAWTTLPAGPASLAAKTQSPILPVAIRRTADDRFNVSYAPVITVASSAPAELQRATQAVADALEATVGAAPDQWYSFKPMWPPTEAEAAELEARAAAMLADDGSRPRRRSEDSGGAMPVGEADAVADEGPDASPIAEPRLRAAEA
jgi:phosphatidylinositol dimannoside acyltransferase